MLGPVVPGLGLGVVLALVLVQERGSAFTRQWNGSDNKIGAMETSASMESRTREPHNGRQLQWEAST